MDNKGQSIDHKIGMENHALEASKRNENQLKVIWDKVYSLSLYLLPTQVFPFKLLIIFLTNVNHCTFSRIYKKFKALYFTSVLSWCYYTCSHMILWCIVFSQHIVDSSEHLHVKPNWAHPTLKLKEITNLYSRNLVNYLPCIGHFSQIHTINGNGCKHTSHAL